MVAIILLVFGLLGKFFLNAFFAPPIILSNIATLEEITTLKFPPSSVLLDNEHHHSMSPQIIAKVSMKKSEWSQFKSQEKLVNEWYNSCDPKENDLADMKKRGWNVSQIKKAACVNGVTILEKSAGIWITADLDRKSEVLVYLYDQG